MVPFWDSNEKEKKRKKEFFNSWCLFSFPRQLIAPSCEWRQTKAGTQRKQKRNFPQFVSNDINEHKWKHHTHHQRWRIWWGERGGEPNGKLSKAVTDVSSFFCCFVFGWFDKKFIELNWSRFSMPPYAVTRLEDLFILWFCGRIWYVVSSWTSPQWDWRRKKSENWQRITDDAEWKDRMNGNIEWRRWEGMNRSKDDKERKRGRGRERA